MQSGTAANSALGSPEGNKRLKNLPVFSCLSLAKTPSEFGRRCMGCRAKGMRHTRALKEAARKRLKVIYAVMRGRRLYVPA